MIKTLEQYITKNILLATCLATLIIVSVLLLVMILGEAKNIGEGDYNLLEAFIYVFLRLPNELYHFSPMLILLGCIIGLNTLSTHRELAVMRSSGFSIFRIILTTLVAALLLILSLSIFSEWLAADLSAKAEIRKENTRNAGQAVITSQGIWLHVDNNFIHIQHIVGRQMLEGVTRYEFDNEHRLLAAYFAKNMIYDDGKWKMLNGIKTTFSSDRTFSEKFAHANWDLKYNPHFLRFGMLDPKEMSLSKLAKYSRYLKQNHLQSNEYQYEFWQRILQPAASLIMVLLAVPFVLSAFKTTTLGRRILLGIIVGFAFYIFNAFLGQLCVVYQLPAFLAASLPIFLFGAAGILLCKRVLR